MPACEPCDRQNSSPARLGRGHHLLRLWLQTDKGKVAAAGYPHYRGYGVSGSLSMHSGFTRSLRTQDRVYPKGWEPPVIWPEWISMARFQGQSIKEHREIPVRIRLVSCDRCSRMAGKYFQSTVQVRGNIIRSMSSRRWKSAKRSPCPWPIQATMEAISSPSSRR